MKRFAASRSRSTKRLAFVAGIATCVAGAGQAQSSAPPPVMAPFATVALSAADSTFAGSSTGWRTPESYGTERRFLRATGEVFAQSLVQNLFGKYVMGEKEGFTVSWDTIEENLHAGMNWDDNAFSTNNFRHPYQGGLYYSAGRSNHYDFYQSSMFAFAGSWGWEYLGEAHNPSFNDFVNTAVGGIILGEVMYRLSTMVLDNTATGSGRAWRELAGAAINPVRGFNRLVTGEAFEPHANPEDRFPSYWHTEFRTGLRTLGEGRLIEGGGNAKVFTSFDAEYGSPFEKMSAPYDHFDLGVQLNLDNKPHGIGRLEVHGLLGGREVSRSDKATHLVTAYQHFDYLDNEAYTYGGMSFGARFQSRFAAQRDISATSTLDVNGILLGATKSDYFNITGREYDYGPGASLKVRAAVGRRGRDIVTLEHMSYFIRSVNGGTTKSWSTLNRVKVDVPLRQFLATGAEMLFFHSDREYKDLPTVHARNPELRVYLSWQLE